MRCLKYGNLVRFLASLTAVLFILFMESRMPILSYANPVSESDSTLEDEMLLDEDMIAAMIEDMDSEYEVSDQDIHEFINEYLKKVESGEIGVEGYSGKKEINPELKMEKGNDEMIRFILPNMASFEVSAPSGMVSFEPVRFRLPDGILAIVLKNGETELYSEYFQLTEPGDYHVRMSFLSFGSEDGNLSSVYEINLEYTICESTVNDLKTIVVPQGFEIRSISKDGIYVDISDANSIPFAGDGTYDIIYSSTENGSIDIHSTFCLDTKAPILFFSKDITQGRVHGPITFLPSESDVKIYITYNGNRELSSTDSLSISGYYRLEVFDAAGNTSSYEVEIRQNWKLFDPKLIIMASLIFVGILIHLLFLRRNSKVL